jgi:RHS repeat-associated protein
LRFKMALSCFAAAIAINGFGQQISIPQPIPASPEASALGKYINYPVSYSTGLVNVSIPLYEIKVGDMTLPISLDYHSSGIKVNENSGWVGAGWSLQAEPSVSRSINGRADETGYLINTSTQYPAYPTNPGIPYLMLMTDGGPEEEPDDFYYRLLGKSGGFHFKHTPRSTNPYQIVPHPFEPVKIDYINSSTWEITDDDGVRYRFGTSHKSIEYAENTLGNGKTAWKATDIISPVTKDTIHFSYTATDYEYLGNVSDLAIVKDMADLDLVPQDTTTCCQSFSVNYVKGGSGKCYDIITNSTPIATLSSTFCANTLPGGSTMSGIQSQRITEIRFPTGRVEFTKVSNGALQYIRVYDKANTLIRQIKLDVSLVNGRYWLNKVEIMSSTGAVIETYTFEYYNDQGGLPVKSSRSIDFYGYYNGLLQDQTLVRMMPVSVSNGVVSKTVYIGSGGRNSEILYMKQGALSKVTYPTGGSSTFVYDANKYLDDSGALVQAGGLRIQEIKDYDPVDGKTGTRNFVYGKNGSGAGFVRRKLGSSNEDYMLGTMNTYLRNGAIIGSERVRTYYSNTLTDLFHAEGSPVVYDEVTEILKDSKTGKISGKAVYKYNHHDRSGDTWTLLPGSGQPTDPQVDWRWGQLISKADYSYVNNQYVLLQRKGSAYTTTYNPATVPVGKAYRRRAVIPTDNSQTMSHEDIGYVAYNIQSGASRLTSDTLTVMNGSQKLVSITNYAYENPLHLYLTRIEHYGSDQVLQTTVQKYPHDVTLPGGSAAEQARQNLVQNQRFNNILEKTETKGAAVTKTRTEYKLLTPTGPALPDLIYANTATANAEEIRVRFNGYDDYGNILSVSKENDIKTSYIWAYDHTLPIAAVTHATPDQIAHTSFETTTDKGNWTYSANPSAGFAKTGASYYTLLVSSPISKSIPAGIYKLEYWAKAAVTISGAGITISDINTSVADVNGWILYQKKLTVSGTATLQLSSATNVQIDELRLYPIDAQMTSYTYKPLTGTTSVTDASNRTVYYNYDGFGRLSDIRDHNRHLLKTFVYHYTGNATTGVPFADVNFNYVLTNELQVKGIESTTAVLSLPAVSNRQTITYLDGLGRPIQTIGTKSSPLGYDVVQPFAYDNWGREKKKFLPYVSTGTTGAYRSNATRENPGNYHGSEQYFFYQNAVNVAHDTVPYALNIFEPSMLNRTLEQGSPGVAWKPDQTDSYTSADHTIKHAYETNASTSSVLKWTYTAPIATYPFGLVNASTGASPIYYPANELLVTKTKDEDGNETIEFTNKDGQVVLKRTGSSTPNTQYTADTYYIYDDRNNLVTVISPEASKIIKTTTEYFNTTDAVKDNFLKRWVFRYAYDTRQRMVKKQVPGAEPVYMVYDGRDRLVMTQDGNQRAQTPKAWTFTKYDALNRPVMTGIYPDTGARNQETMQQDVNSFYVAAASNADEWFENRGSTVHGYTDLSFPKSVAESNYLTVTYYDDYGFKTLIGNTTFDYNSNELTVTTELPGQDPMWGRVTGQVTGAKVKNLGNSTWLWTVNYYDDKNRVIQSSTANHLGGIDCMTLVYDWPGKALRSKTRHRKPSVADLAVTRRFTYDHAGRLLETWHTTGAQNEIRLTSNKYNELGQLVTKTLFNTAPFTPAHVDPLIGEPNVVHESNITSSLYDNKVAYIASNQVRLLPGFSVPAGKTFTARIGPYTRQEGDVYNAEHKQYSQVVDYRYNIRGWLSRINSPDLAADNPQDPKDLFGIKLDYNEDQSSTNYNYYNGNIRFAQWSVNLGLNYFENQRRFNYVYDQLNQLSRVDPAEIDRDSGTSESEHHSSSYEYDLNGNIQRLYRKARANSFIDNMTYSYGSGTTKSNKLLTVDDAADKALGFKDSSTAGTDYGYDANGNTTSDRNKGIDGTGTNVISYYHLNLPKRVQKSATAYIDYAYDATGRKLRQFVKDGAHEKTSDYIGEFFYENDTLKFINHEEGRIVMTGAVPEYQYNLKDHLGNVYLTFTTKATAHVATATMENVNAADEAAEFLYYDEAVKLNFPLFNHTPNTPTQYSTRLNGTTNERFGLAKSLSVMPGDTVRIEAFAKYLDPSSSNWTVALQNFIANLPTAPQGTLVDGGLGGSTGGVTPPWIDVISKSGASNTAPKAYLNYIIFDRDFQFIDGGFIQVGADAKENGTGVAHQRLYKGDIVIRQPGYVRVYLSNENPTPVEVYFDDFSVMHVQSPVVQLDEYHPFGLTFNSLSREKCFPSMHKYNGKEQQDELDLDWLDYGARMYQPESGRFFTLDRFSEKYYPLSPYGYAANNPIKFIDVNGDSTYLIIYGAGYLNMNHATQDHDQGNNFERNAQALKHKIEQREGFDPERDQVIVAEARSTEQFTDATNKEYESGKIASLTVFSHGTESSISLGGEMDNDAQLHNYDLREININTVDKINKDNFEGNASITLYGCNIGAGGVDSFAQTMSTTLGLPVKAFDGSAEAKTKNRDGKAPLIFDGTMIRTKDRRTQRVQLSTFYPK